MPGCSAANCSNRTEQGFFMKSFPRDPHRRAVWAARVNRENWTPTKNCYLCQVHFDDDQWEVDKLGKRKLKRKAEPTLFYQTPALAKIKVELDQEEVEREHRLSDDNTKTILPDIRKAEPTLFDQKPALTKIKVELDQEDVQKELRLSDDNTKTVLPDITTNGALPGNKVYVLCLPQNNSFLPLQHTKPINQSNEENFISGLQQQVIDLAKETEELKRQNIRLKVELNQRNTHILRLKKKLSKGQGVNLHHVFNDDQVKALTEKNFRKWSDKTCEVAVGLRFSCGKRGYQNLLNLKYPLPSIRTLQRWMRKQEKLKGSEIVSESQISTDSSDSFQNSTATFIGADFDETLVGPSTI